MTRSRLLAVSLVCGSGLISALALAWAFNSLLIAGSTPATIWSPALPAVEVTGIMLVTVALVGFSGPRLRPAAIAVWLIVFALLTHRVVDGGPDGLKDLWFGLPLTTITDYAEADPSPRSCRLMLLPALCVTRGGRLHTLATVLPFRPAR